MLRLLLPAVLSVSVLLAGAPAYPQENVETLADIRKQLIALQVQLVRLRHELEPTGTGGAVLPAVENPEQRVDALEIEFRRIVKKVELIEHRINRIAEDGNRQIRDLEFRLIELEGGDVSAIGEGTAFGGEIEEIKIQPLLADTEDTGEVSDLAVHERELFETAMGHFQNAEYSQAGKKFRNFTISYPSGPYTSDAHFYLGESMAGQGQWAEAAKAFLDSFSMAGDSPMAAMALYRLGVSFGRIEKKAEACAMLNEVWIRYPESEQAEAAREETALLECS